MKTITVSVDETIHRKAHDKATELNTSVSALVIDYLRSLANGNVNVPPSSNRTDVNEPRHPHQRLRDSIEEIRVKNSGFRASDNLPREELYDRSRARAEALESANARRRRQETSSD